MTVSQESNGTKVARPWTSPSRAARRALCPRQSSTSPATPRGANGHRSYGGSARATRAPLTAAPANRGPSPAGRQREGAAARSAASGPACPVAVLVTVGAGPSRASSSGTALTRGRAATVQRPGAGSGAGGSGGVRRPHRWCPGPGDGSGPGPPFGPTSSGRLPDRRPLSTGRSGPSRVSPPGTPPHPGRRRRSDLATGRRLRIASSLARSRHVCVAEGDSLWVSCGGRRSPWGLRLVPVNRPVTCADAQSRRSQRRGGTRLFPFAGKGFGVSAPTGVPTSPEWPIDLGRVARLRCAEGPRRCRRQ